MRQGVRVLWTVESEQRPGVRSVCGGEQKDRPGGCGGCGRRSRGPRGIREEAREGGGQIRESQKCLLSFFSAMRGSQRIPSRGSDFLKRVTLAAGED